MKYLGSSLLVLVGASLLGGCKEYFSVSEACSDKLPSSRGLSPTEQDAMLRLNCHRRLAGLSRAVPNELVTRQANDVLNYVLLNPSNEFLYGTARENAYLNQLQQNPGFTGLSVYDRLTSPSLGYIYYDEIGSNTREYIDVQWTYGQEPLPSGAAAVDYLMKDPQFRQSGLQPSWLDGAYAEIDLSPEWFAAAGVDPLPTSGKAYYLATIYTEPHIEHADSPVVYPKEGQTDVPLWAFTHSPSLERLGEFSQTGYPITFTMGAIDPANYFEIDFNQYRADILNLSLIDQTGALVDTALLMPGDELNGSLPDGKWLRTTIGAYPLAPLAPSTRYTLSAEISSPAGEWSFSFDFTTVAEDRDPGIDLGLQAEGLTTATTTTTAGY
jgi:hypothetical protein